jgi:hypothetical protein
VDLLPAAHEWAKRSPLAQRDNWSLVNSQPVHFHFSGFTANFSSASAEITQLSVPRFFTGTFIARRGIKFV